MGPAAVADEIAVIQVTLEDDQLCIFKSLTSKRFLFTEADRQAQSRAAAEDQPILV